MAYQTYTPDPSITEIETIASNGDRMTMSVEYLTNHVTVWANEHVFNPEGFVQMVVGYAQQHGLQSHQSYPYFASMFGWADKGSIIDAPPPPPDTDPPSWDKITT